LGRGLSRRRDRHGDDRWQRGRGCRHRQPALPPAGDRGRDARVRRPADLPAVPAAAPAEPAGWPDPALQVALPTAALPAEKRRQFLPDRLKLWRLDFPRRSQGGTMSAETEAAIFLGRSEAAETLPLKFANRHGLIAGATGTGKTVTLQ